MLAAIVHRLSEEYARIELKSDDGKKRMAQDAALLSSRLGPLSESGKSVASLEMLVRDKPTPRRPIGQAMRGMLSRVNSGSGPKPDAKGAEGGLESEGILEEDEDGVGMSEEPENMEKTELARDGDEAGKPIASEEAAPNPPDQNGDAPLDIDEDKVEDKIEDSDAKDGPAEEVKEEETPALPAKDDHGGDLQKIDNSS